MLTASLGRISPPEFWTELGFKTVQFMRDDSDTGFPADFAIRSFAELSGAAASAFA